MKPASVSSTVQGGEANKRGIAGTSARPSKNPPFKSVAASAVKPRSISARRISTAATISAISAAGKRKIIRLAAPSTTPDTPAPIRIAIIGSPSPCGQRGLSQKTIDKAKTVFRYRATVEGETALYGRLGELATG